MKILFFSILFLILSEMNAQIYKVSSTDTSIVECFESTNYLVCIRDYFIKWGHQKPGAYCIYQDSTFKTVLVVGQYDSLSQDSGIEYHYHENGALQSKIDWTTKKDYWFVPEHKTFDNNGHLVGEFVYSGDTLFSKYYDLKQRLRILDKEYLDPEPYRDVYFYRAEWDSLGNLIKVEYPDYFRN